MATLQTIAKYEIGFLLTALMAVVVFQLLTGRIRTRGLLSDKKEGVILGISPARVQLLLFTLGFAFYLLSQIVKLRQFPIIDTKWLLMLAGSHTIFLGSKVLPLFRDLLNPKGD